MRIYTIHAMPRAGARDDVVAIKEGFSWPAFLFDVLWMLYHGLWYRALFFLALGVALEAAFAYAVIDAATWIAALLGMKAYIGFGANDWRRRKAESRGYVMAGIAGGADGDAAQQRFHDRASAQANGARGAGLAPL